MTSSGGFRVYDRDHTVSYNYVQDIAGGPFQGPLQLDNGEVEGTSTDLAAHWRVVNALVERNVIVACPEGVRVGDNFNLAPTGCTIRDNVVAQTTTGTAVTQVTAPVSSTLTNNTYSSTPAGAGLAQDSAAIWRKTGYGPRLTYLLAADVGITGDPNDADGTGTLLTGAPPVGVAQTVYPTGIASREAFGFPTIFGAEVSPPAGSVPTLLGSASTYLGTATLGYTMPGVPPPPSPSGSQTVSGAGNISSGQALGLPVVSVADGPLTVNAIGITSGETFGSPTVTGGAPPAPAPGGVLVPALFAVGSDGSTMTPLPFWSKIGVSPVRNSPGAITVDYPAGAPGFTTLADGVSANPLHALEVRVWLGGNATGALGGWLVQKSGDDLTPGSTWTFSGHFQEWLLKKAIVAPQPKTTGNEKGELKFAGATAGLILSTVMNQAQSRGALPLVTRDFSSTKDSNGQPWANQISSLNLAPKTTAQQVADKLVELGMCEYELTAARVWRAYNPGTRGKDRTLGGNPLMFAQATNLAEHSRRESTEDAGTAVLAAGSEGFYEWSSSATAQAELGWRAEVGVDAGQVSSETGVQAAADTQLEIVRHGAAEYDGAIEFTPGSPLPLIDYGIGDWAYVVADGKRSRLRIAQLGLTFQPGRPPAGTVALNDLIADKLVELWRRFNAISAGDAVVGTSTSTPGGTGEDLIPPAAPTGLTAVSNVAVTVPGETVTQALLRVGWAEVVNDAYPDAATAQKALAATLIAARFRAGSAVGEDWTWTNAPAVVSQYNDALIAEWQAAGFPNAVTWLEAWPPAHQGGGAITDDVASYRVAWAYLGTAPVGGNSGSPYTTGLDPFWQEPTGSPTSQLSIDIGGVEGGRSVGIRVAAIDRAGNQGPWSAVLAIDTAVDNQPPPRPSKPIVAIWFETLDVTWDGKGAASEDMVEAAPDFLSGGGVEVHVGNGIAFLPDRPVDATGKVNLAASQTYKSTLYTAGTTNVTGLTVGVTYFARLVAVDRNGNASEPSDTSDGALPQQLVNIDIGPNAIAREQIIDGEIVNAKIGNLSVNDAKISDLSVGKITAGTMVANVVLGGRFSTPSSNNNHLEIDPAGIRLFQNNTVVGRWQVADASILVTGTYLSGLTGERINLLPDGSARWYGAAGTDYASIQNNGGIVQFRSRADASGNRAYADFDPVGFTATYRDAAGNHFSRFYSNLTYGVIEAPVTGIRVYSNITPEDNTQNRFHFVFSNSNLASGDIGSTVLHYVRTPESPARPAFNSPTNNSSVVFGGNEIWITGNSLTGFGPIGASAFNVNSARAAKANIHDVDFGENPGRPGQRRRAADVTRSARVKKWEYVDELERPETPGLKLAREQPDGATAMVDQDWTSGPPPKPQHWGPMAEDLEAIDPDLLFHRPDRPGEPAVNVANIAGIAWAAAADAHDDIEQLITRIEALEAAVKPKPPGPNQTGAS